MQELRVFDDFEGIDDARFAKLLASIDPARYAKASSFHTREDQQLSVVGGILMSRALEGRAPRYGSFGKPLAEGIGFNISHCQMCVALLTSDRDCGVDVEAVRDFDRDTLPLCFTTGEQKQIVSARDSRGMYYTLWTLKESYLKTIGSGISHNLLSIEFEVSSDGVRCSEEGYLFDSFLYAGKYRISGCTTSGEVLESNFPPAVTRVTLEELCDD
jgi:4'-phosphopantetheinyl transferase